MKKETIEKPTCSTCSFYEKNGITLLSQKWLDPECHKGCRSLAIHHSILETYRKHMESAVIMGEISEGEAKYSIGVLDGIINPAAPAK